MRLIAAFLRMVRWQNLFFIALTQILFYWGVYAALYDRYSAKQITFIIIASVFIAAAGYIINDYFDLNIDQINKPSRNVVNSVISRRWAIFWHLFLSGAGLVMTWLAVSLDKWHLIAANALCIALLWFACTTCYQELRKRMEESRRPGAPAITQISFGGSAQDLYDGQSCKTGSTSN